MTVKFYLFFHQENLKIHDLKFIFHLFFLFEFIIFILE